MHCETLLRLSIEEVNFTSVWKTNVALSVLKAKQLQWTTTVSTFSTVKEILFHTVKNWGVTVDPQQNGKNISGGLAQWTGGSNPLTPGNSHPGQTSWKVILVSVYLYVYASSAPWYGIWLRYRLTFECILSFCESSWISRTGDVW